MASITGSNPLPIELLSFDALPNGNVVNLEWSTASEIDNLWFDVERSADAYEFADVIRVPGAINSQSTLHYSAVDVQPLSGTSYYRLRQTDVDGTSTVSNVVTVVRGGQHGQPITVVSNDGSALVYHGMAAGSEYVVFDAAGRMVLSGSTLQEGPFALDLSRMSAGAYTIRMWNGADQGIGRFVR